MDSADKTSVYLSYHAFEGDEVSFQADCWPIKARLHRRFLSQQLDAIFVALKLQLQNRTCKPGAILTAICPRDIVGVSNMFET